MEFRKTKDGQNGISPRPCALCTMTVEDDIVHGKFHVLGELSVHYYCLLFACALEQKGDDSEGILGFLEDDVKKEIKRGKKLKCLYCNKTSATIGCVVGSCRKQFHRPCGVENGALFQFFGQFKSFCCDHRPVQSCGLGAGVPKKGKGKGKSMAIEHLTIEETDEPSECPICYDSIVPQVSKNVLWAPCCRKRAWFHRDCVQQMALSAGYHFRCPLCNDKKIFKNEMKEFGIYIPDQDASWEQVPNPYQELYERYCHCDALKCINPRGRDHDGKNGGRWGIVLCDWCGSQGTHVACSNLKGLDSNWVCVNCAALARDDKLEKLPKTPIARPVRILREISDSDEDIEVCAPSTKLADKLSKVVGSMFLGESTKTAVKTKTTARKSTSKNGVLLSPARQNTPQGSERSSGPSHSGRRLVKFGATQFKLDVDYLMRSIQANNVKLPGSTTERMENNPKPERADIEVPPPPSERRILMMEENGLKFDVVGKVQKPAPLSVKKKLLEKVVNSEVPPSDSAFHGFEPVSVKNPSRNMARRGGFAGRGRIIDRMGSGGSSSESSSLSSLSPSPPPKPTDELRFRVGPDGRILDLVFPEVPDPPALKPNLQAMKYKPGPKSKKILQNISQTSPEITVFPTTSNRVTFNKPCPKSKKLLLIAEVASDDFEPPCKKSKDSSLNSPSDSPDQRSGTTGFMKELKKTKEDKVIADEKNIVTNVINASLTSLKEKNDLDLEIVEVCSSESENELYGRSLPNPVSRNHVEELSPALKNLTRFCLSKPGDRKISNLSVDSLTRFCLTDNNDSSLEQSSKILRLDKNDILRLEEVGGKFEPSPKTLSGFCPLKPASRTSSNLSEHSSVSSLTLFCSAPSDIIKVDSSSGDKNVKKGPSRSDIMVAKERLKEKSEVVNEVWDSYENGHGRFLPSSLQRNGSRRIVVSSRTTMKRK